ncbi:ATP-binding protein [Pseudomonas chlororaphis]|nr:ATP-binding protein [Pseudomonas chlororaphis]
MDEPDSFLHPQMVLRMIACFKTFIDKFSVSIIFTTHSPTTVALAPEDGLYVVEQSGVSKVDRNVAIAELLVGVTQVAVSPHNRRQVYVESHHDVCLYQTVYEEVAQRRDLIDPGITLAFVSSGTKLPKELLKDNLKKYFKGASDDQVNEFCEAVNGVGCSALVKGTIEALLVAGGNTFRGLIDRDKKESPNKSDLAISVLGGGDFYAIENVVFDPVGVLLLLHNIDRKKYSMEFICGQEVEGWWEWLGDRSLLQISVNKYIQSVMGRESFEDCVVRYVGGMSVRSDSEYINYRGYDLWNEKIRKVYIELLQRGGNEDGVKLQIIKNLMCFKGVDFIPEVFVDVFRELQKPL